MQLKGSMKFLIGFMVIFFAAGACSAQQGHSNVAKQIYIPSEYLRLDTIASLISRQSSLRLSMNTGKFPPSSMIHLQKGFRPVSSVLADIQKNIGNAYKVLDDYVIFIEKPLPASKKTHFGQRDNRIAKPPQITQKTLKAPINALNADPSLAWISPVSRSEDPVVDRNIAPASATGSNSRSSVPPDSVQVKREVSGLKVFSRDSLLRASSKPATIAKGTNSKRDLMPVVLMAGISANELLYANPTLKAGIPLFYAIGSWSSNFKRSEFRWGAGTSFDFNRIWKLRIEATTGVLKGAYDSTGLHQSAKERLYRIALLGEKQLSGRLKFEAGIGLNDMMTRYFANGSLAATSPSEMKYAFDKLHLFNPPYTISDHYRSASGKNNKFWIGVQVGLFYNLDFFKQP